MTFPPASDAICFGASAPAAARKPVITQLTMTCGACPSQWEGRTSDGGSVFVHYRHGWLSISFKDADWEEIEELSYGETIGDSLDGVISHEDMMTRLRQIANVAL